VAEPPLTGLRILDLSHNLAGPLTAMHLGDLGAEVIKVERPGGDEWRRHERLPGEPDRSRHYIYCAISAFGAWTTTSSAPSP
jgi:crotonobetainyl-CoA:carnitine CoA-transferase CaiB-like acyl-CoA transferase